MSAPGLSATVGEEIEALRRIAGDKAVKLIREEANPTIVKIVDGWPRNFDAKRALSLGFKAESSMKAVVQGPGIPDGMRKIFALTTALPRTLRRR